MNLVEISIVQSLIEEKNFREALDMTNNLIYRDPRSIAKNIMLLRCLITFGYVKAASRIMKNLRKLRMSSSNQSVEETTLLMLIDDMKLAEKHYVELKYSESLITVDKILKSSPKSIAMLLLKTKCLIRLNDINRAEELIKEILIDDPENSEAVFRLSVVRYYQGHLNESFRLVKKSVNMEPEDENRYRFLQVLLPIVNAIKEAQNLIDCKNFDGAICIFSSLIDDNKKHEALLYQLLKMRANAFEKASQHIDAIEDYSRALSLGKSEKTLLLRAKCFYNNQDYNSCFNDCETYVSSKLSIEARNLMKMMKESRQIQTNGINFNPMKCVKNVEMCPVKVDDRSLMKYFIQIALKCLLIMGEVALIEMLLKLVELTESTKEFIQIQLEDFKTLKEGLKIIKKRFDDQDQQQSSLKFLADIKRISPKLTDIKIIHLITDKNKKEAKKDAEDFKRLCDVDEFLVLKFLEITGQMKKGTLKKLRESKLKVLKMFH